MSISIRGSRVMRRRPWSVPLAFVVGAAVVLAGGVSPAAAHWDDDDPKCTIRGTSKSDRLVGTDGPDVICGRGGSDVIDARGGDDVVIAGSGNDTVTGGAGRDRLLGDSGSDTLRGGRDADHLDGDEGKDVLDGGSGDDRLAGGEGEDRLDGSLGVDALDGGKGKDSCRPEEAPGTLRSCERTLAPPSETADGDADELPDAAEERFGSDPNRADTDGDGLDDIDELRSATDPANPDTDGDGVRDPRDDQDGDRVDNASEIGTGTDPLTADTDGDGADDGTEASAGTDPLVSDTDGDGLSDGDELRLGSDPLVADSDGDGVVDSADSFERSVALEDGSARFVAQAAGNGVLGVDIQRPVDDRLADVPGQRAPPVEVIAPDSVTGTLTIEFDPASVTPGARLAVLHFDVETGTFDAPPVQSVDAGTGVASVTTDEFSPFIVVDLDEFEAIWQGEIAAPREGGDGSQAADAALVLDSSGSMATNDPGGARKVAAKSFVDALLPGDRVTVVDFDSTARILAPLTEDFAAAKVAIDTIDASGGTSLTAGVAAGLDSLDAGRRDGALRVLVLLTDGIGDYSPALTQRAIDSGTVIYTVGLGSGTDQALLDGIATATGGKFFLVANADDLGSAFDRIGSDLGVPDTDSDGIADEAETTGWRDGAGRVYVTDPLDPDSDDDGLTDGDEAGDLLVGAFGNYYRAFSDPNLVDTDNDGLDDGQEFESETDARDRDTDNDGLGDLLELDAEFDPLDANPDGDTYDDFEELAQGSDPFGFDITLAQAAGAVVGGFVFGDAWDSFLARLAGIDVELASSIWYLIGQLVSGFLLIGDVRDVIYDVVTLQWGAAVLAAIGLIPALGDVAKTVVDIVNFARKSLTAVRSAIAVATRVLPRSAVDDVVSAVVRAGNARLARDVAVSGRAAPPSNFNIASGTWRSGRAARIGGDPEQARLLQNLLDDLTRRFNAGEDISDVRVNQRQADAAGSQLGINRPDVQYTFNGERYYVEYDRPLCSDPTRSRRGDAHELRLLANDPGALTRIVLVIAGACE